MSRNKGTPLILGITPEAKRYTFSALFENAGRVVSAENLEACYQNGEAHATDDECYLLLHSHPEEAIAHCIANGTPPKEAREAWLTAANAMVNFYKRHRNQAVMVYVPNLLANPIAQLAAIATQLGLPEQTLPTTKTRVEQAPLLERIMARQLLQQTPGFDVLLSQIEACTLPLADHSYSASALDFDAASGQLVVLRANLAESKQLAMRLQKEASQYHAVKQKAETAYEAELNDTLSKLRSAADVNSKLEEKLANQQQQYATELARQNEQQEALRSQLPELTLQVQKSQEESNMLLEQLHLVQEELEAKFISHKHLQEQLVQIEAQQKRRAVESDVKKELKETLVKLRSVVDKNRKLEEDLEARLINHSQFQEQLLQIELQQKKDLQLRQKTEKTLQQTKQKRREVEAGYKEDLKQARATLRGAEKTKRKLEDELTEFRDQRDCAMEVANNRIERLQQELNNFKSSFAFKVTAPVRAIKTRLRGYPAMKVLKNQSELVRQSGLFNEKWYLETYPDVAENGIDPILHYLKWGAEERRNPSPEFDTDRYLTNNPEAEDEGINPLLHYFKFGQQEERRLTSRHRRPSVPTPGVAA